MVYEDVGDWSHVQRCRKWLVTGVMCWDVQVSGNWSHVQGCGKRLVTGVTCRYVGRGW